MPPNTTRTGTTSPASTPRKRRAREPRKSAGASAFRKPRTGNGAGPGDGSRSRDEMRALDVLELDADADFTAVKAAYRRLAKEHHPDLKPGDKEAAEQLPAGPGGLRSAAPGRRAEERQGQA